MTSVPDFAHIMCVSETLDDELLESLGGNGGNPTIQGVTSQFNSGCVALSIWESFYMAYACGLSLDGLLPMSLMKVTRKTRFVLDEEDFWHLNENVLSGDADTDTFMGFESNIADAQVRGDLVEAVPVSKFVTYYLDGDDTRYESGLYARDAPGIIAVTGESRVQMLKFANDPDTKISDLLPPRWAIGDMHIPHNTSLGLLMEEHSWVNASIHGATANLASRIVSVMLLRYMAFAMLDRWTLEPYLGFQSFYSNGSGLLPVIPGKPWDITHWRRLVKEFRFVEQWGQCSELPHWSLEPMSSEVFL